MIKRRYTPGAWWLKIRLPFRQLLWKIIGGHMLVVIVGVLTLSLASELIVLRTFSADIRPYLTALIETDTPEAIETITTELLQAFYRDAVSCCIGIYTCPDELCQDKTLQAGL